MHRESSPIAQFAVRQGLIMRALCVIWRSATAVPLPLRGSGHERSSRTQLCPACLFFFHFMLCVKAQEIYRSLDLETRVAKQSLSRLTTGMTKYLKPSIGGGPSPQASGGRPLSWERSHLLFQICPVFSEWVGPLCLASVGSLAMVRKLIWHSMSPRGLSREDA